MPYIHAIVVPVPKKNLNVFKKLAKIAGKAWRKYGATKYVECVAVDVPEGEWTSFPKSVKLKKGETVIWGYLIFPSRAKALSAVKKMMADKKMQQLFHKHMPFDGKRMFWGGFKPFVSL